MKLGRLTVHGGFVLLWGVLVYLEQWPMLGCCLAAAITHEIGHGLAVLLCGGRIEGLELNVQGAVLRLSARQELTYGREILCVLAGPGFSLAAALLFLLGDGTIPYAMSLCGICLTQGLFNLLPAEGLDGGAAVRLILEWREVSGAAMVLRVCTAACALSLTAAFAAAFFESGRNLLVLLAGVAAVTAVLGDFAANPRAC